ncbi:hypothetical protein BJ742DRAFT_362581 [Cladochytrium replicatum]|nr:hypothetical protein BJ742DRAFT_362581 [Cladochytrium replicatum]
MPGRGFRPRSATPYCGKVQKNVPDRFGFTESFRLPNFLKSRASKTTGEILRSADLVIETVTLMFRMPNVEQIRKEQSGIVMLTTQFLAKTQFAHTVLTKYLSLRHLQRIPVRYVGHTSLDPLYMGGNTSTVEMPRDFRRFFHAYGHSGLKSTRALLRCWKTHPEWPTLTVVGMNVTQHKDSFDDLWVPDNVEMKEWVDLAELRRLQRTHSMHLCPSVREGFGHYINEGRGVGALVITTDFGPMNEIVDYGRTGILIQHVGEVSELHQLIPTLGVNVQVNVDSERICEAVAEALEMPLTERERMGDTARTGYERDQALMRLRIRDLKVEVVREFFGKKSMSSEQVDAELMRIELPLIDRQ